MNQEDIFLKKQWFIKSCEGKIEQYYDINLKKVIGSGTYGSVVKAVLKGTKQQRAVKVIPKSKVKNPERFKREIDILRAMDHPNIIKLYETYEDQRNVYLVTELCEGGELFDRIMDKGYFNEAEAHAIFLQIIQALNYCHSNGICHRDLKPENFLFLTKADDSPLKVIDFGLSILFEDGQTKPGAQKVSMKTKAGTPYYISPEVLKGNYDELCDIWSAGVILYILLSGVPPFYGDTDPEILESVQKGVYTTDIPEFKFVSDGAKDLIANMITTPDKRFKASQVLQHKWMKEKNKPNKELKLNYGALKNFTGSNKLKKVALTFIASQLNEQEISHLGKLFKQLDKNGDGVLTIEEIREGLTGMSDDQSKELANIIKSIDTDGNGNINYTEFLAATMEKQLYMKEEKLYQAFKMLDLDGSGKIDKKELQQVLGKAEKIINEKYWDDMIKEADKNGDGEIDYNEFIEMMDRFSLMN
ncbi:unnamed protein product (macronuclear) [Paramecium tetraurelia]|uniref:Calcium-dependent protein kinase 1 n=1 Tax=Paramecium tetraurelia TaxID=5888 RepID=A0DYJ2_PARTE|nr:uncharacterized protein GSPATT00003077001 [Paramecium tetraurelia]CAK88109.1 unnamed protein product [Paramecium tetraurelia]|eukprot:XP_001455506.1 hypothetical protein (macronuclear) [Paramecium tetraurelia strain d4-2]